MLEFGKALPWSYGANARYSQVGIAFSGGLLKWVHVFISRVLCVVEWERSSFQCRAHAPIIDLLSDFALDIYGKV